MARAWYSPDCAAGKHAPACVGQAWDEDADAPTGCACPCHEVASDTRPGLPAWLQETPDGLGIVDRD